MIRNYDELLICIKKVDKSITEVKKQQRKLILNLKFIEAKQLLSQQQLLELQVLNYIEYYKEKIKHNHLENKLYSIELNTIKQLYQTTTIANTILQCLKDLKAEYDELQKYINRFSGLKRLDHINAVKEERKNLFYRMEKIYEELRNTMQLQVARIDEEEKIHYNSLIEFFKQYYISKIENLNG